MTRGTPALMILSLALIGVTAKGSLMQSRAGQHLVFGVRIPEVSARRPVRARSFALALVSELT